MLPGRIAPQLHAASCCLYVAPLLHSACVAWQRVEDLLVCISAPVHMVDAENMLLLQSRAHAAAAQHMLLLLMQYDVNRVQSTC